MPEILLHVTLIPINVVTNHSFVWIKKQEPYFYEVGLVVKTKSVFVYSEALYFKGMSNSIKFPKGIFSHVVPVSS